MPNSLAYLMLLIWPLVAVGLFARLPIERALVWSILGAYLILPPIANFDFPLVPPLDKVSIPNITAFAACVVMLGHRVPILPVSPIGRALIILSFLAPLGTTLTNSDPIIFGVGGIAGLGMADAISAVIGQTISMLPFFLARRFLHTEAAQREILIALVVAGLAYSVPMLMEIRLSPQINVWVYGFFQHDFIQMMREGGYRPIVFLPHGLWVAFFAMMTTVAAAALWRAAPPPERGRYMVASGYLGVMLVLCKSLGALLYAMFLVPVVCLFGPKAQIRIAAALALVAVLYPLLRGADLVPVDAMLSQAAAFNQERADSLGVRFKNEADLLERASERPLFGWGGWGRNRIYDPDTGEDLSVTDGRWAIVIGTSGWCGYLVEFGLLALPAFLLLGGSRRRLASELSPYAGPLALILAVNLIDLLPNATLIPFTWLLAGAMLGYAEELTSARASRAPPEPGEGQDARPIPARPERPRTIL